MKKIIEKIETYMEQFIDFQMKHEGVFMTIYLIIFIAGFMALMWHLLIFVNYLTN